MILFTNLVFVLVAFLSRAARHWQKYYETIIFVSCTNLMYNLLCKNHLTWIYHADFPFAHKFLDITNTIVLLPFTTLLYLHFYPTAKWSKFIYYLGWIALFCIIEGWWGRYGRITYDHSWNYCWSIVFYFAMFYVIGLHSKNRSKALWFSFIFTCSLLIIFKVPFWK